MILFTNFCLSKVQLHYGMKLQGWLCCFFPSHQMILKQSPTKNKGPQDPCHLKKKQMPNLSVTSVLFLQDLSLFEEGGKVGISVNRCNSGAVTHFLLANSISCLLACCQIKWQCTQGICFVLLFDTKVHSGFVF